VKFDITSSDFSISLDKQVVKVSVDGNGVGTTTLFDVHEFLGGSRQTTFVDDTADGAGDVFIAGSGGGIFYLKNGDTAVGNPDAQNIYYIHTDLASGGLANINILNFGSNDKIYVWNNGGWKPFTGYASQTVTEAYNDDLIDHDLNMAMLSRTGGASNGAWSIQYQKNVILGTNGVDPAGEFTRVTGLQANVGVTRSDIQYEYIAGNAGVLTLTANNEIGGLTSGVKLSIESATSNLGTAANFSVKDSATYLGVAELLTPNETWPAYSDRISTPGSSDWSNNANQLSAYSTYVNDSIYDVEHQIARTPHLLSLRLLKAQRRAVRPKQFVWIVGYSCRNGTDPNARPWRDL
jgi:hypothetical protein